MSRRLFQVERNAELLIEVLRSLVAERKFELHDFVIMPDHVHLLLTVEDNMTIEKALQMIKGRFSYRLSRELGYKGEVWQRGLSEVQVTGAESFDKHREYIAQNPMKAGLAVRVNEYPFCFGHLAKLKAASKSTVEMLLGLTALRLIRGISARLNSLLKSGRAREGCGRSAPQGLKPAFILRHLRHG